MNTVNLSKSGLPRKRFKKIESKGEMLRVQIMDTLKGKKLVLHFDGKIVKELCEDKNISVECERIAVSVTSPAFESMDDVLLGVVQAESSKGYDQAHLLLNLLEYYIIADQIFAVCCDTTSSNTGVHSGAIQILTEILDLPLVWIMCRHHVYEVHVSHFMEALTGQKTKGPRRQLYVRLKKVCPSVVDKVNLASKEKQLKLFDWSSLQPGSVLHRQAVESLAFCSRALLTETFPRGDYKKMCKLVVVYLGGEVEDFQHAAPGACHEARFMADALYLLTLQTTSSVLNVMDEEEKMMVKIASFFIATCYAPWFLQSYLGFKAPANDLCAFKVSTELTVLYPKLGAALTKSFGLHSWSLTEKLVPVALCDPDLEMEEKMLMVKKLLGYEIPEEFEKCKPTLPKLTASTELHELVGAQSWILLKLNSIQKEDVQCWVEEGLESSESYQKFCKFIRNLVAVNDCVERNIKLIQEFVMSSNKEDMRQNIMLVAKDNRKKLKKTCLKADLKKL